MSQHDYVIANGTGSAVRSDLNNALAAIVSQNSGATAPSTTYAYQWWADTTTGLLKLRNAANSAWITLFQLDGEWSTIALENGTAAAPSIYFKDSGTDTGFYSPGTDQVGISTGGTARLTIDANGNVNIDSNTLYVDAANNRVGLGTSSPSDLLTVGAEATSNNYIRVNSANNTTAGIKFYADQSTLKGYNVGYDGSVNLFFIKSDVNGTIADRFIINDSGNVGIGTTSPTKKLQVEDTSATSTSTFANVIARFVSAASNGDSNIQFSNGVNASANIGIAGGANLYFGLDGTERARIDTSGRLLVGTSTARSNYYSSVTPGGIQVESGAQSLFQNSNNATGSALYLGKSRGTTANSNTVVQADDQLGTVIFFGADGTNVWPGAQIGAFVDGTPGANDMPGRLVFSTTADGASSPTERMRITQDGIVSINHSASFSSGNTTLSSHNSVVNGHSCVLTNSNGSFNADGYGLFGINAIRSANSGFAFAGFYSGNASDKEFGFRGDGNGYCDGSWNGGGADYAEYFEWSDGNPDEEDRRGISVVLDGEQIRPAVDGEDPIGVISGNPSVVGDAAWNKWSGKYLRDDYGTYIQEDYEVVNDEGETVIQQRRKLNPAYDPDQEYINREDRPEWDCVGLMGKLRIRKGQPTGSRWIKMRDISDSVEEWLVR
jgi:hypothetical protein